MSARGFAWIAAVGLVVALVGDGARDGRSTPAMAEAAMSIKSARTTAHHRQRPARCAQASRSKGRRRGHAKGRHDAKRSRPAKCPARRRPTVRSKGHSTLAADRGLAESGGPALEGLAAPGEPVLSERECWEDPGEAGEGTSRIEGCGYPGFRNTGVEAGQVLTGESGTVVFTSRGWRDAAGEEETGNYEDRRLHGKIEIEADAKPAVLKNDEVFTEAGCTRETTEQEPCSTNSVEFQQQGGADASGFVFSHMRLGGTQVKGPDSVNDCINGRGAGAYRAEYVKCIYGEGFAINGGGELSHVYCPEDHEEIGAHYECIVDEGVQSGQTPRPLKVIDSTLFQPPPQNLGEADRAGSVAGATAALFMQDTWGNKVGELVLEGDFLAGGAFTLYGPGEAGAQMTVRDTRFARCLTATCPHTSTEEGAGSGDQKLRGNFGDGHGWFERSGVYGILYPSTYIPSKTTWEENFWDDDLESITVSVAL
jgi:hypothetical protein